MKVPLFFCLAHSAKGSIQKPRGSQGGGGQKSSRKNTFTYMSRTTRGGGGSKNPKNRTTRFLDAPLLRLIHKNRNFPFFHHSLRKERKRGKILEDEKIFSASKLRFGPRITGYISKARQRPFKGRIKPQTSENVSYIDQGRKCGFGIE